VARVAIVARGTSEVAIADDNVWFCLFVKT
jgi:hypothetical protein